MMEMNILNTELVINIRRVSNISIVEFIWRYRTFTCLKLRKAIVALIDEGNFRVVINMTGVNYIDSSGLGTLVGGLKRISENKAEMAILGTNPHILKVFLINRLG